MVVRRVVVHGTVQGVFFRDSCATAARQHGVSGWVRNTADGSVEALFAGPAAAVERMVEWVRHGPSRAVVERVEVSEGDPDDDAVTSTGFTVRG